jgi:pantoate--beta-alanine ligase
MQILSTIAETRRALAQSQRIGLVPTMGALHEGHLSLIRAARRDFKTVVVSIFVNPTQFAAGEDLDRYPRTFAEDCRLLEREGVDILFAPSAQEMYPSGQLETFIEVPGIADRLDGASRPGHFRGVATVVAKLFHIIQPQAAFFGQKDAAQVAVLRAMVRDLNFPVNLHICPTARDADGLALSSRNRFLSADERTAALAIYRALRHGQTLAEAGADRKVILPVMLDILKSAQGLRFDYVEMVHPDTLLPHPSAKPPVLIAIAAWAGNTRLIDNILVGAKP